MEYVAKKVSHTRVGITNFTNNDKFVLLKTLVDASNVVDNPSKVKTLYLFMH